MKRRLFQAGGSMGVRRMDVRKPWNGAERFVFEPPAEYGKSLGKSTAEHWSDAQDFDQAT